MTKAARALTGFRADWRDDGSVRTSYERESHDAGRKHLFGKHGRFDYKDVLDLCVGHPAHAPFMVGKLWEFFVGTSVPRSARTQLMRVYRGSGLRIRPVVGAVIRTISQPACTSRSTVQSIGWR